MGKGWRFQIQTIHRSVILSNSVNAWCSSPKWVCGGEPLGVGMGLDLISKIATVTDRKFLAS